MIDAIKKLDKKFLVVAICILLLPILIIMFLAIAQGCTKTITYEKYEEKMISAFERYLGDKEAYPEKEGELVSIDLSKLVKNGYIKSPEKLLNDNTCKGTINVRRNGASVEQNNGGFLNYIVDLNCETYSTVHLIDKVKKSIVTSDSGLYQIGEEYIFKGDNPKNYVNFYGLMYRIISVDKNGMLKLVRAEPEITRIKWDDKYNIDVNNSYGINIYKDSYFLKYLLNDYINSKKVSKKAKHHVIAYDVCIGKRSSYDYSISRELDCSALIEKQLISSLNISDFALASLDPNCNSTRSRSCTNFNYLSKFASSTWTLNTVTDNSYQALFLTNGLMEAQDTYLYNEYNLVIYIDGNEPYKKGIGSEVDPYTFE